jgi:hypothetical protein
MQSLVRGSAVYRFISGLIIIANFIEALPFSVPLYLTLAPATHLLMQ